MPPKKPITKTSTTAKKTATSKPASKTISTTKTVTKTTKPATKTTTTSATKDEPKQEEELAAPASTVVEEMEIRNLKTVLVPDSNHKWYNSGKWPCLLDPSEHERVSTFLRHTDTNYLKAMDMREMAPESIRLALLGSLRYGKPLVMDLGGMDRFDAISDNVNKVQDGLMNKILNKSILKEEEYRKLIKESDDEQYSGEYIAYMEDKFVFIVYMAGDAPPPSTANNLHFILVTDNK